MSEVLAHEAANAASARARALEALSARTPGRVLVAMSGGVDSSVALSLLTEAGFECIGVTMRLYDMPNPRTRTCCSVEDVLDARATALSLGVEHEVLDLRPEFEHAVIEPFCAGYAAGFTPNPCIECNRALKFGLLEAHARELGCDYLATGHYAYTVPHAGAWAVHRAADRAKDQSYVLYPASAAAVARMLLPLGVLTKADVRAIALEQGLVSAEKVESQDVCFVPDEDYAGFLQERGTAGFEPGPIVDASGRVLGEHAGQARYTIGQRKGLGVALGHAAYVLAKDAASNTVTVGTADELRVSAFAAERMNWHVAPAAPEPFEAECCVRYHGTARPVLVEPAGSDAAPWERVRVRAFGAPYPSVAPGQSAVLYANDLLVGGGIIAAAGGE